ncbi:MAG: DUF3750 domain-containing protein [Candidatus Paceibacterota bacterium]|jgi:hypothetical protein
MFTQQDYSNLIDSKKNQVFLFKSMASFPFIFAVHPWFVLNKQGEISRWEVAFSDSYPKKEHWGHLYKNLYPFFQGIEFLPFANRFFNKGKLIGVVEGDEASKIIDFIYNSPITYNNKNEYKFIGPNSNTYAQWVISNSPDCKLKLPNNAYGKNYKNE